MKGLLDRLFGRDNVEELNSLLGIIHEHWLQYFKEGWAQYLYTNNIPCAAIGEVFGCKEYWKSVNHQSYSRWNKVQRLFRNITTIRMQYVDY